MNDEKIKRIAYHYGVNTQLDQTIEECAELAKANTDLIQAICKYKRYGKSADGTEQATLLYNIAEEIADVEIMIKQIKILLPFVSEDAESIKTEKLDRQIKRINKDLDKEGS